MRRITSAQAQSGYRLALRFEDGASGVVDLSGLVGKGVFSAWSDPAVFGQVTVNPATGTVTWPGGIDLDPDQLHHDVTGAPLPGPSLPVSR
ncbi:MAG: DUF2442 domain-containing protein [bacterium]